MPPYGLERDFMERCRIENRVASDVLRGKPDSHPVWSVKRDLETSFDRMEKKNAGYVTREEYVPV